MPEIIVAPHLDHSRVGVQGVITVPSEMATIGCLPTCQYDTLCLAPARMRDIPLSMRALELVMQERGRTMISRLAVRGYRWLGELRFHGPFPSREYATRMTDLARSAWGDTRPEMNRDREHHPEHVLEFVHEDGIVGPYMDYVLIGNFVVRNVLTEIPVKEE